MPKKRKGAPVKYSQRNWSKYNKGLVKRGKIIFMIAADVGTKWLVEPIGDNQVGGQPVFTDFAIESCLQIRSLMKSALRQTEGFVEGLFEACKIDLPVPDYSLLSKRGKGLNIPIKRFRKSEYPAFPEDETRQLMLDSTGLKTCGEGEWLKEKHNTRIRQEWRKAHIGIDGNGDIIAASLTTNKIHDADEAVHILGQISGKIGMFLGDGAYDQNPLHNKLEARYSGIKIVTPPRKDAVLSGNEARAPTQRDKHILKIQERGRKGWAASSKYNQRNLVENTIYRYKTTFGGKLKSKNIENQNTEFLINCNLLNKMNSLCKSDAYKVKHG